MHHLIFVFSKYTSNICITCKCREIIIGDSFKIERKQDSFRLYFAKTCYPGVLFHWECTPLLTKLIFLLFQLVECIAVV